MQAPHMSISSHTQHLYLQAGGAEGCQQLGRNSLKAAATPRVFQVQCSRRCAHLCPMMGSHSQPSHVMSKCSIRHSGLSCRSASRTAANGSSAAAAGAAAGGAAAVCACSRCCCGSGSAAPSIERTVTACKALEQGNQMGLRPKRLFEFCCVFKAINRSSRCCRIALQGPQPLPSCLSCMHWQWQHSMAPPSSPAPGACQREQPRHPAL